MRKRSAGRPEQDPLSEQQQPSTRWVYWSFAPLGLGAWTPIYAGVRARNPRWIGLGVLWSLCALAGFIHASVTDGKGSLGGLLMIVAWIGAIATSLTIRSDYAQALASPLTRAARDAQARLEERERALAMARRRPLVAREIGIGRPDLPEARDGGLIDVNNVPAAVLAKLPGVDPELALAIEQIRGDVNGFSSLEDLGTVMDLDPRLVEGLRERTVFLPRQ